MFIFEPVAQNCRVTCLCSSLSHFSKSNLTNIFAREELKLSVCSFATPHSVLHSPLSHFLTHYLSFILSFRHTLRIIPNFICPSTYYMLCSCHSLSLPLLCVSLLLSFLLLFSISRCNLSTSHNFYKAFPFPISRPINIFSSDLLTNCLDFSS